MAPVYMRQTAKGAVFLESCSEVSVLLRRGVSAGISEAIYCSHGLKLPESHPTLKGQNVPLFSHVMYLGAIFDKRNTWRLYVEMIEAKAFRAFINER
jgi:hypothetical protein